jgi:hypothetical protein
VRPGKFARGYATRELKRSLFVERMAVRVESSWDIIDA